MEYRGERMSGRYKRRGWHGNSHGHSLAAKGIKLYARKEPESFFYAQKNEKLLSTTKLADLLKKGASYNEVKKAYPDADAEDIRKRGIKVLESREGNNTLSTLDRNGVDMSVTMAQSSSRFRESVKRVLGNKQMASFLPDVKVAALQKNMRGM